MFEKEVGEKFRLPVLKTRNNNLAKRWYVEYYLWDEHSKDGKGGLVRQVQYCPRKFESAADRRKWGKEMIVQVSKWMHEGFYKLAPKNAPAIEEKVVVPVSPTPAESITLKDAIELIVEIKESAYRKRTGESYRNIYRRLSDYLVHYGYTDLLLSQTTSRHVYEFSDYIVKHRKLSSRYRNNLVEGLGTLFEELAKREYISKNPAAKVTALPVQTSRKNIAFSPIQRKDLEDFLREKDPILYKFTRFVYQAFLRPVELMRLQIRDIELVNKRIVCHSSITKGGTRKQITEYVEITPQLQEVILTMNLDRFPPTHFVFSKGLLPGKIEVARNRVSERHHNALVDAEMYNGELTLYSWKHTGVVNAYKAGASIEWLRNHLRHSDLRDTVIYLKSLGLMLVEKIVAPTW